MAESEKVSEESKILGNHDPNAKWDVCIDLGVRSLLYSSLSGALVGLLLFRSPVTRWSSVALGAGIGIGSAYTECSQLLNGSAAKLTPNVPEASVPNVQE